MIRRRDNIEWLGSHRIINAVYYFYALPRAFTGGPLRLHSLATKAEAGSFVDIEPECDPLVYFPSWFPYDKQPSGSVLDCSQLSVSVHRIAQRLENIEQVVLSLLTDWW